MNSFRRLFRFAYAVLLRALAAIGGAVTAYGATGMFTSAGIMPPNVIVLAGLAAVVLTVLTLWASEHRLDGLWPALALVGVPYALYAFGSWSSAECPADHPSIGSAYTCAPVGTHAIAIVAPVIALLALVLFVRDVRALAKREPSLAGIARNEQKPER